MQAPIMYYIVESTSTQCEALAVYDTHDEALQNVCHFINVYDSGNIEILSIDELIAIQYIQAMQP